MSEFHTEARHAIASEGHAQGPYVAARSGFEPATLRAKGAKSTNEPRRPTLIRTRYRSLEASTLNRTYIAIVRYFTQTRRIKQPWIKNSIAKDLHVSRQ